MNEEEIQRRRREQDERATQRRAAILGLPYLDTRELEHAIPLVKDMLPVQQMHQDRIVPLVRGGNEVMYQFGVTSQTPQSVLQVIRRQYEERGDQVQFSLISLSGYRALMLRYDPPRPTEYQDIKIAKEGDSDTIAQVSQTLNTVTSSDLFDFIIQQADRLGASDIHIENERDNIRVRLRVDGALHPVAHLERDRYRVIMGELASRAGISTAAYQSQSGHMQREITTEQGTHLLNIRVETVPTVYGQDAVLRLFRKLITLEDPVEYSLSGISQIPIDTTHGQSFADGLRSVLRLDPDVVMVGEIRDTDTARTAIQASITGHLVLSSFHANSTSAAFSRMIDMIGVNPIFSSAIRLVIAQRLVRRLVDTTKEEYEPDEATRNYVKRVLAGIPASVECPDLDTFKLWRPKSSNDAPFGYRGRIVIMEQLIVTEEIQKYIRGDVEDIHPESIEQTAKAEGMLTLEQVGVLAALRGDTTLEEVGRVI